MIKRWRSSTGDQALEIKYFKIKFMFTPDYICSDFTGIEKVTCSYYQDIAITHYYFIGYVELCIVAFLAYYIIFRILGKFFMSFLNK